MSAVPLRKDGTNFSKQVGFTAVPIPKNGGFEINNGGFSAVPQQNNGNSPIFQRGLSAVPLKKKGTNFTDQVGFAAEPIAKNGDFENFNGGFSVVPNQNIGNISTLNEGLAAATLPKNGADLSNKVGFAAKAKVFRFFNDKKLKLFFFVRFGNFLSRTFSNGNKTLGGRGHRFILTLECHFPRIKYFENIKVMLKPKSTEHFHILGYPVYRS